MTPTRTQVPVDMILPSVICLVVGSDEVEAVELVKCPLKGFPEDKCSSTVRQGARVVN